MSKNLVLPSANNLTLPSGNNLILGPIEVEQTQRGKHSIFSSVTGGGQRGAYNVFGTVAAAQRGKHSIFTAIQQYQRGRFLIFAAASGVGNRGRFRVADDTLEGFIVRVGYGAMPDHTQDPDGSSATRPVTASVTPPSAGTEELWVVLRTRNKYGLESENQQVKIITIDSNGDEVLGDLTAPTEVEMTPIEGEGFLVTAHYPGYHTDPNRGDDWKVYIKADSAPVPGVDTPVATAPVVGDAMVVTDGPYPEGGKTYYAAVTVYRDEDSEESDPGTYELVLPADPSTPTSVPTGWVDHD